jgi:hypothetical protein
MQLESSVFFRPVYCLPGILMYNSRKGTAKETIKKFEDFFWKAVFA